MLLLKVRTQAKIEYVCKGSLACVISAAVPMGESDPVYPAGVAGRVLETCFFQHCIKTQLNGSLKLTGQAMSLRELLRHLQWSSSCRWRKQPKARHLLRAIIRREAARQLEPASASSVCSLDIEWPTVPTHHCRKPRSARSVGSGATWLRSATTEPTRAETARRWLSLLEKQHRHQKMRPGYWTLDAATTWRRKAASS
jgi:hypothetical protein